MIHDSMKNAEKYFCIHPRFKTAFDFLSSNDLTTIETGKIELEGKDLFVNVVDITGKSVDEARMETHNNYIDIQIPIGASENMGWKATHNLSTVTDAYNTDKDVTFFSDKATSIITAEPFEFVIFFPEDGHQPGIGEGTYRKIIVKVRV